MISVVIPALNEEKYLAACLESLKTQDFPKDEYEIIVVDNASEDRTAEVARSFGVRVFYEPRRGYAPPRQTGFAVAQGEIIASTDADTVLPPDWLKLIKLDFENDSNLIGLTGLGAFKDGGKVWELVSKCGYFVFLWAKFALQQAYFSGSNFAVKKWAFEKVGGFDLNLKMREDVDLARRLARIGKIKFNPKIVGFPSGRRFKQSWTKALKHYLFQ